MLLKLFNLSELHKSSFFYLILNTTYNFADKLIGPIFVVYLQGFGLSHFQIGLLMSISSWLTCLLDFPTGNISDLKLTQLERVLLGQNRPDAPNRQEDRTNERTD